MKGSDCMCSIICNVDNCKYNSPTWYCLLESIELDNKGVCTCYQERDEAVYLTQEEFAAFIKDQEGEIEL